MGVKGDIWSVSLENPISRPPQDADLQHLLCPLYSICTVYVQYLDASEAYKYCTYTVHILYNGRRKWVAVDLKVSKKICAASVIGQRGMGSDSLHQSGRYLRFPLGKVAVEDVLPCGAHQREVERKVVD